MPGVWSKLLPVAHTLPYDATIMDGFVLPKERFARITVPVLMLHGGKTEPRLVASTTAVAAAIPGARHDVLPGQRHDVSAAVLAPAVVSFLQSGASALRAA